MPTIRQRKALDRIVENHGNVSKSMREAGYPYATAKNPKNLTESQGFRELLEEYGLNEGLITKSLVEDIKKKEQNRLGELRLGSEILGMTEKESTKQIPNINIINFYGERDNNTSIRSNAKTVPVRDITEQVKVQEFGNS